MSNFDLQIPCNKSLTISTLNVNENYETDELQVGFNNNIYRSYVYFDLSTLPKNLFINYAFLRLYLKQTISIYNINQLNLYPLTEAFGSFTTFKNQPSYIDRCVNLYIDDSFNKFLDINITSIFYDWYNNYLSNDGLLLKSDEKINSLLVFSSPLTSDYNNIPTLSINCTKSPCPDCPTPKETINTIEKAWSLSGYKSVISPQISVERILQGTFFIKNTGSTPFTATVEVSTDSFNWFKDNFEYFNINEFKVLVPNYYGKYYRVSFSSQGNLNIDLKYIYQVYA